ncbi:GNAT family N-acetyltransferase [bacterium]|nr:GNAT family N-acetyltransferase [bacterium]
MNITPITPTDKPVIQTWLSQFLKEHLFWWTKSLHLGWDDLKIREHIEIHALQEKAWERLLKDAGKPDNFVRIIRINDLTTGIIHASFDIDTLIGLQMGQIQWIYVDPQKCGLGYGQHLLKIAHDWFSDKNLVGVRLHVNHCNDGAKSLYKKFGYQISDEEMLFAF